MDEKLAKRLLSHFFKAPLVNAMLVFEDNSFLGAVLKKDIERGIIENNFNLFENINIINESEILQVLFYHNPQKNATIPVIDKGGNLIKIISFTEFESQFSLNRYLDKFKTDNVIEYLDHPVLITNCFKKILYLNREALKMIGEDFLGHKLSDLLKRFDIEIASDRMIVSKDDNMYHLIINYSSEEDFDYQVYQFFLI
jgi:hypothetical protein